MINLSIFAERLKEYAEERNLSVTELAKRVNCSRATLSALLNGSHAPSTETLIALSEYFNCSADYLLGKTDIDYEHTALQKKPFNEVLRKCLKEGGISEYRFRKNLGVSSSLTYRWLNGLAMPNTTTLCRLAEYFGCSVDYLLGREG